MAGWRQAVALAMTGEEIEALTALSRSRTEPAGRVSRAAMLLGYREKPSFFAVGRRLGVHHQTVQRCVEPRTDGQYLARLRHLMTDRDRAKSRRSRRRPRPWLKYLWPATRLQGARHIRMNCGRHGFWPAMRASADRRCAVTNVSPVWLKRTVCKLLGQEEIKPHKVRYYLERRDAEFEPKMAEVLVCLPRGPGPEKHCRCQAEEIEEAGRDRLLRREAWNPGHRHDGTRICRQCQAAMRASRGIMSTNAMARSACLAGIDLLTGRVHAARQGAPPQRRVPSRFLKLLDAAYPASTAIKAESSTDHSAHISRETRAWLRHPAARPLRLYLPRPSTAPGST